MIDDVLHHVEVDHTLRVIPPTHLREALFKEAHSGLFGGHLRSAKIHGQLAKHYWWPGMRADIVNLVTSLYGMCYQVVWKTCSPISLTNSSFWTV